MVSLTRQIARVGHIGSRASWLAQSFIESTGIRRESVRQRPSSCSLRESSDQWSGWQACRAWRAVGRGRRDGLLFLFAPSALREKLPQTGQLAGRRRHGHSRPLEKRPVRRKRGAPSVCRMRIRGLWQAQLAEHRRGAADGWFDVHRAG